MSLRVYAPWSLFSIHLIFAWYDFWIGIFWDSKKRRLYILPIPCLGIMIQFASKERLYHD
jgi:hypothetical protein